MLPINKQTISSLTLLLVWCAPTTGLSQEVSSFIRDFNARKIEKLQESARGYISPSLLKNERRIIRPLVKIDLEQAQKVVDQYYQQILAQIQKDGDTPREQDLQEHQRSQKKLRIAWKEAKLIAKEANLELIALKHKVKNTGSVEFLVIIFSSQGEVVMVKTLAKIAQKVDIAKEQLEGRKIWIHQLIALKKKIES